MISKLLILCVADSEQLAIISYLPFAHAAGVGVAFDPNIVTVDEGSPGTVCATITNGTIDRSVSITFNVLRDTGTASNSE